MKHSCIFFCFFATLLAGCSMQPATHPVQVEVNEGVFIRLPEPAELGHTLNVSQLISAQWGEGKQQKLMVQLQADSKQVVLAGFSAWGARLLSLSYSGEEIQTYTLNGLADTLPKPEQVLFNLMLSIWPVDAWRKPLRDIGWQLVEKGLKRELVNEKGQVIVQITYQTRPYINGVIKFKHQQLDYTITIETNKSDNDR